MVKGCQKKTIHIRDTGSKYYEEAYLILRPGAFEGERESAEMIDEAMRIVGESFPFEGHIKGRGCSLRSVAIFAAGSAAGAVITCAAWLIMNMGF